MSAIKKASQGFWSELTPLLKTIFIITTLFLITTFGLLFAQTLESNDTKRYYREKILSTEKQVQIICNNKKELCGEN